MLPHSLQPSIPSLLPVYHVDFICWNNILPLFSLRVGATANWQQFSHLLFLAALLLFLTRQIGQISAGGVALRPCHTDDGECAGQGKGGTSAYTYIWCAINLFMALVVVVVPSEKVLEVYFLWRGEGAERCPSWISLLSEIYIHTCLCTYIILCRQSKHKIFIFFFFAIDINQNQTLKKFKHK